MKKTSFYKGISFGMMLLCILTFTIGLTAIQGRQYSATLEYGEYYYIRRKNMGESASIQWSFTSNNIFVGIGVLAMNEVNFAKLQNGDLSAQGYVLSDGTFFSDSGVFNIPYFDDWAIVFWHVDLFGGSTTLTINVIFEGAGLAGWLLSIIIAAPVLVVIIIVVVVLVNRKKKQQIVPHTHFQPQVGQPLPPPPPPQPPPLPPPPVDAIFCWNCGQANKKQSTFCMRCGKDLTSPEK